MKDKSEFLLHLGAKRSTFDHAKELRVNMTSAERNLWEALRNGKLKGYKFRRQHPLKHFVADFYCHQVRLVIEVDGGIHKISENKEYDEGRSHELEDLGLTVLRFTNEEVLNDLNGVLYQIEGFLTK